MNALIAPGLSDLLYVSLLLGLLALTIDPGHKPLRGVSLLLLLAATSLLVALYSYMRRDGDWTCMTVVYCTNGLEYVHLSGLVFLFMAIYVVLSNLARHFCKKRMQDN
jgi:hypothetical protein